MGIIDIYYQDEHEGAPVNVETIKCDNILDGLAILHERLNEVAMPRVHRASTYKNTIGSTNEDIFDISRPRDGVPVTISC